MSLLQKNILHLKKQKDILLVSHAVLGFPSIKLNEESIDEMIKVGVDIIELQIPFSDPQADGPFFTAANQKAIETGISIEDCLQFAEKICKKHPDGNFVFMTYFNIPFKYGLESFIKRSEEIGVKGFIIPDLPFEESGEYEATCKKYNLAPIFIVTPTSNEERIKSISQKGEGFLYCQARTGVTGTHTKFNLETEQYIERCKKNSSLPLAFGFGIQKKEDVDFLKEKVDIAICCTQAVKVLAESGAKKMGEFLKSLR
ncbi:tryptophan synthase subunit alpha [Candidatus Peregrinibacteria bacterium]|jgi:tryptophan synthase alpha chain|nr:tryptophan synthase subunit alpha [Candidatus Peregrinibacteria bacterium]